MRHYELYEQRNVIEEQELDLETGEFISSTEVITGETEYKLEIWSDDAHTHLLGTEWFEELEDALEFIKRDKEIDNE